MTIMTIYSIVFVVILICIYIKINKSSNITISQPPIFIHIPKNAGSYIEEIGKANGYKWGKYNENTERDSNDIPCNHWHIPPKYMKDVGKNEYNNKTFCIIRDPYERMISEYKWFSHISFKSTSKEKLNEYVHTLPKRIKNNPYSYDCHLLPQTEFIFDENGNRTCDVILEMNDLNTEYLNSELNLNLQHVDNVKRNALYSDLSIKDLDQESIDIINTIYASDFNFINS